MTTPVHAPWIIQVKEDGADWRTFRTFPGPHTYVTAVKLLMFILSKTLRFNRNDQWRLFNIETQQIVTTGQLLDNPTESELKTLVDASELVAREQRSLIIGTANYDNQREV